MNFERKSTAGFRHSVLAGWVGGVSRTLSLVGVEERGKVGADGENTGEQDAIKTIYFFATDGNSVAFKVCPSLSHYRISALISFATGLRSLPTLGSFPYPSPFRLLTD